MKLALLTNYEILGPPQVERWNTLARKLEERGVKLVLLTTNTAPGLDLIYIQIPYALREFVHLGLPPSPVPGETELVGIEEYWIRDFNEEEARAGARACRTFYQQLLDILEPDVVAPWNALFPHGRIVQLLCEERGIPVYTFERGFLPGTLMLERLLNNAGSELNNSVGFAHLAKQYSPQPESVEAYRRWYLETKPAKYSRGDPAQLKEQDEVLARVEKPLLLVLSQAHGGGIYPRKSRLARRNFAHFQTLEDALSAIFDACPHYQIAFRDHPINALENAVTEVPAGVLRLDHGPIHQVLAQADVVVTLGSTTALYEALVLKKPLVVVGDSPIGRFSPYVRCTDGDVGQAVAQATEPTERANTEQRAEAALGFLLEQYLFSEDETVPVKHTTTDLADFLSTFDLCCARSLEARFSELSAWAGG